MQAPALLWAIKKQGAQLHGACGCAAVYNASCILRRAHHSKEGPLDVQMVGNGMLVWGHSKRLHWPCMHNSLRFTDKGSFCPGSAGWSSRAISSLIIVPAGHTISLSAGRHSPMDAKTETPRETGTSPEQGLSCTYGSNFFDLF